MRIDLPPNLPVQKPNVKVGDKVLGLAWERNPVGTLAVGSVGEVVDVSELPWKGWIKVEVQDYLNLCSLSSWAVVNGPVKPGDTVIAIEYITDPRGHVEGEKLLVDSVTVLDRPWVRGDGAFPCLLSRWAKLESKSEPVALDPQMEFSRTELLEKLADFPDALDALGLDGSAPYSKRVEADLMDAQGSGVRFVRLAGEEGWYELPILEELSLGDIAGRYSLKRVE